MINGKSVLALIPARGGSKGIKDKNIILLEGKPLINYTIETAIKSSYIDRVVVTTDSDKIAEVAMEAGADVPFKRPAELAADSSKTLDAVLHAINWLDDNDRHYDILVLLQPTQPLRNISDIDDALEKFEAMNEQALVSICEVDDNPVLIRTINDHGLMDNLINMNSDIRRQDMPIYYKLNGAVYINKIDEINENTSFNDNPVPYLMAKERSVDIDDLDDLEMAKILIRRKKQ